MTKKEKMLSDCSGIGVPETKGGNGITELVFILDRSGSMAGFETDTIGGFNSTIEEQRQGGGRVFVTTWLFDTVSEMIHDRVDIAEIKPMTRRDYRVRGCTALLDTIGGAIKHVEGIHKYARPEDVPEHTIFVITTDGMENASRNYTYQDIKKAIKGKTEKNGWEFIFLAANIDAEEAAEDIGISRDRAANYTQDREGMDLCFRAMNSFVSQKRTTGAVRDTEWKRDLEGREKKNGR